jgi:hypothetical protein
VSNIEPQTPDNLIPFPPLSSDTLARNIKWAIDNIDTDELRRFEQLTGFDLTDFPERFGGWTWVRAEPAE